MESSRTSLASRTSSMTHSEVLRLEGQVLGLEASSPRKLSCPRLEDSTIFWIVKVCRWRKIFFLNAFFLEFARKIVFKNFFFGEHLCLCPWSLTWDSSLVSSIPPLVAARLDDREVPSQLPVTIHSTAFLLLDWVINFVFCFVVIALLSLINWANWTNKQLTTTGT